MSVKTIKFTLACIIIYIDGVPLLRDANKYFKGCLTGRLDSNLILIIFVQLLLIIVNKVRCRSKIIYYNCPDGA